MAKTDSWVKFFIVFIVFIVLAGGGYWIYSQNQPVKQEAFITQTITEVPGQEPIANLLQGKASTLTVRADDVEASSILGVSVPLYVVKGGEITTSATVLSPSGTTITGYSVGDTISLVAFNNTYSGEWIKDYKIPSESPNIILKVHRIAPTGFGLWTVRNEASNAQTQTVAGRINITSMSASQSNSLTFKYENNGTYMAYDLGGFYADTVVNTNITTIDFATDNPTTKKGSAKILAGSPYLPNPRRGSLSSARQSLADKIFEVQDANGGAFRLRAGDYIKWTGSFLVNGNGCPSVDTGEALRVYAYDIVNYVSYDNKNIFLGAETDAPSPADVGSGDTTAGTSATPVIYCVSGTNT